MTTPTAPGSPPIAHADDADDRARCRCGAAPTAFKRNTVTSVSAKCLSCAAVDRHQLEPLDERNLPLPEHLQGTPIALIHPRDTVWNHQAIALGHLRRGDNVVVATPTASGKTLIFHLHTLAMLHADPQAATLVMYPAKALANDQLMRWKQAAETAGFSPDCVQQITGDVPMRQRQDLLRTASIVLMTPDVVHAWLIRSAHSPTVSAFLRPAIAYLDPKFQEKPVPLTSIQVLDNGHPPADYPQEMRALPSPPLPTSTQNSSAPSAFDVDPGPRQRPPSGRLPPRNEGLAQPALAYLDPKFQEKPVPLTSIQVLDNGHPPADYPQEMRALYSGPSPTATQNSRGSQCL